MTLRKILFSVIGLGCSWIGASAASAQVSCARGVHVVAVVQFDGRPKTAADVQMERETQYYESANRLYAAQQQYRVNQQAAYQNMQAQQQWRIQQFNRPNPAHEQWLAKRQAAEQKNFPFRKY